MHRYLLIRASAAAEDSRELLDVGLGEPYELEQLEVLTACDLSHQPRKRVERGDFGVAIGTSRTRAASRTEGTRNRSSMIEASSARCTSSNTINSDWFVERSTSACVTWSNSLKPVGLGTSWGAGIGVHERRQSR